MFKLNKFKVSKFKVSDDSSISEADVALFFRQNLTSATRHPTFFM